MNFYEFINREELEEIRQIREQIQMLKQLRNTEEHFELMHGFESGQGFELGQDGFRCLLFEQQMFDDCSEVFT